MTALLLVLGCTLSGILISFAKSESDRRHTAAARATTAVVPSPRCSNDQTSCATGNVRVENFCAHQNGFITQRTERLLREGYTLKGAISKGHPGAILDHEKSGRLPLCMIHAKRALRNCLTSFDESGRVTL